MRTARFLIVTLVISLLPTYTFGKTEARAKFSGVVTEAPGVYEVAGAAQTSTTGFVQGTVTDPQGAVVAGAEVKLLDQATNRSQTEKTNAEGLYTFVNVLPGTYTVTVTTTGFRTAELGELKVEVNKSYTANFTLELGEVTAVVQVQASVAAELQSTDAQVGNVIETKVLRSLPTFGRSTLELISLQPTTTPGGFGSGGTVSGARSDQNTILLDGVDVSDNLTGGQGVSFTQSPVGVDAVSEFRMTVTNPNATFGRSAGGQVTLVSPRGGNAFHGVGYWYHQNDNLNANSWTNNRVGIPKKELKDNRGGFGVNGPIWKDHTFFFGNYEVRRFPQSTVFTRLVPTNSLRNGTLTFRDASGNIVAYPLANSTRCGDAGNLACDPRGLGISPTVKAMFDLLPAGNDITLGDGLNTTGFRGTAPTSLTADAVTFRLDHLITQKMQFMGRYSYQRNLAPQAGQLDIRDPNNVAILRALNTRGANVTGGLDYTISQNIVNSFRFGWVQNKSDLIGTNPFSVASTLGLTGTNSSIGQVAIDLGILNEPIDVAAQSARTQILKDRNIQYSDSVVWTKGSHTMSFGGEIHSLPFVFTHNDQVTFLTGPIAALASGSNLTIPAANQPPPCSTSITTNCLRTEDQTLWNNLYAATLGMLDNLSIVGARDGSLNPLPFGNDLVTETNMHYFQFHFQDTWRVRPSLTVNYGLNYSWATPPTEKLDRIALVTELNTGEVFSANSYLEAKRKAAEQGQVFNPTIGVRPIKDSGRDSLFDTDYSNLGPRIAVAWNPSYDKGILNHLLGDRRSVVRAGFGIVYDRVNTVSVILPAAFGIGFGQVLQTLAPPCNSSGTPGPGCNAGAGAGNRGLSAFRLGVDGSVPVPSFAQATSPIVPAVLNGGITYATDPERKIGRNYLIDFTIQRELPARLLMEVGYIGRLGRDLPTGIDLDSSPYFFKDSASGQTFAQAYDRVACVLRGDAGKTIGGFACPASLQAQPWFENQLPGVGTATVASAFRGLFLTNNVSSLFLNMSALRLQRGLPAYNNLQLLAILMASNGGTSNYHAMFATLRNRPWHGLQFDLNYTLSKALDQVGDVQNNLSLISSGFDRDLDYGPAQSDRRHIFNSIFTYDLPFGAGQRWSSSHGAVERIIGGWYVSGIYRAYSSLPYFVTDNNGTVWGGTLAGVPGQGAIPTGDRSALDTGVHAGVGGSGGVGTVGNPGAKGSGLNLFPDPEAAFKSFRRILLSQDGRQGRASYFRGPGFWNLDFRVAKSTRIAERVRFEFSFDFFNVFNHVNLAAPSLSLSSPANFGVFTSQVVPSNRIDGARAIQFGSRISF
jgi:Carboxypeptidase regulatory-like domain